jgi:hypothetical protein
MFSTDCLQPVLRASNHSVQAHYILVSEEPDVHGLSGKFPNVQKSPQLRRPCGVRQVLLSSNEFDELRRENRIVLSCLVIVLCFFM